jgi:disulfide oxidoreductase YuzD
MSTQYKATCKCGATVDVPYSDNFKDWLNSHKDCLKQQAMPRTWLDLTDDEMLMIYGQQHEGKKYSLGRMVQQALNEKNNV